MMANRAKDCDARVEVLFLQDLSGSFTDYLGDWQEHATDFAEELTKRLPESSFALGSFKDKPFPFVGYGWGDYRSNLIKDHCYKMYTSFTDEFSFAQQIGRIEPASGGNDIAENQFEAIMNSIYDPVVQWSDDEDVIKLLVMITNSTAHGVNLSGQPKASGGEWRDTSNYTRGWDYWWSAKFWKESYGRQYIADQPDNYPYRSFVWDTETELYYHENCGARSEAISNYTILGEKIDKYGEESLTEDEKARWEDVLEKCNPTDPYEYIGVSGEDELALRVHPQDFVPESDCLKYEYPNQEQAAEALKAKNVYPVVISIAPKPAGHSDSTPWLKFTYGCNKDSEVDCVSEFYSDIFAAEGIDGLVENVVADSRASYYSWSSDVMNIIEQAVVDLCPVVTTSSPTTVKPDVSTATEPDCEPLREINPVCDTDECTTFINFATWQGSHEGQTFKGVEGVCSRFLCDCL